MAIYCGSCGCECKDEQEYCKDCGAKLQKGLTFSYQDDRPPVVEEMPMKWYYFIIYFQLFANAFFNAIEAVKVFLGLHYEGRAEDIYALVTGLKALDVMYAIIIIGIVIHALITRSRLRHFKRNGPRSYYELLIAQIAVSVLYYFAAGALISSSYLGAYYEPNVGSLLGSVLSSVIMLLCNRTYFKKREHLFVEE